MFTYRISYEVVGECDDGEIDVIERGFTMPGGWRFPMPDDMRGQDAADFIHEHDQTADEDDYWGDEPDNHAHRALARDLRYEGYFEECGHLISYGDREKLYVHFESDEDEALVAFYVSLLRRFGRDGLE